MGMTGQVGEYVFEYTRIGVPSSGHLSVDRMAEVNVKVVEGWEVHNTLCSGMNARDYVVIYCLRRKVATYDEV